MTRPMTGAVENETLAAYSRPVLIAAIDTAGGMVRVWGGVGDLSWDGDTYQGTGILGGLSPVAESSDLRASGMTFTLSGVPASYISTALGQMRQGLSAKLWLGFMDSSWALIADPVLIFSGLTDVPTINESGETATIGISVESRLVDLERPRTRRYTHEDQQLRDPGDRGFEYVPALQDTVVEWR